VHPGAAADEEADPNDPSDAFTPKQAFAELARIKRDLQLLKLEAETERRSREASTQQHQQPHQQQAPNKSPRMMGRQPSARHVSPTGTRDGPISARTQHSRSTGRLADATNRPKSAPKSRPARPSSSPNRGGDRKTKQRSTSPGQQQQQHHQHNHHHTHKPSSAVQVEVTRENYLREEVPVTKERLEQVSVETLARLSETIRPMPKSATSLSKVGAATGANKKHPTATKGLTRAKR